MKAVRIIWCLSLLALFASCGQEDTAVTLKAVSYNIRYSGADDGPNAWEHRRGATLEMLRRESPDLVGMQEVLADQFDFLAENSPQYGIVGVGRDDGLRGGEMMAVMYKKERLDKLEEGHFWLSETPDEPSLGWDGACNRMVTWLCLYDKEANREIYFLNTHLDHIGQIARTRGAALIATGIHSLTKGSPFILTGDFNAAPDDRVLEALTGSFASARETAPLSDSKPTFNGFGRDGRGQVIDHIYYRGFTPTVFRTLDGDYGAPYISDHYPVEAVFTYTDR